MSTQTLQPASYNGPSGGLKKSTIWLASEDIGLDVEKDVTIQDVELHRNVKFDQGRTEEKVAALRFNELEKRMILNATNRKMLVRLFGMDTKDWRGKRVALYVDPDVKMAGQIVNGLRIRPAQTKAPRPTDELIAAGDAMAAESTAALEKWWTTALTKEERQNLKDRIALWKAAAEKAKV